MVTITANRIALFIESASDQRSCRNDDSRARLMVARVRDYTDNRRSEKYLRVKHDGMSRIEFVWSLEQSSRTRKLHSVRENNMEPLSQS